MTTLMQLWSREFASHTAVIIPDGGPAVTYGQLEEHIHGLMAVLRQGGIEADDPVAIVLPNGLEFLTSFLAVTWLGAMAAPLNPAYKTEEFRFYMEDAGVKTVLLPPGDHAAREAAAQLKLPILEIGAALPILTPSGSGKNASARSGGQGPAATDVALFLHTSGTTSRPKGVPLTHGNLMASLGNIVQTYQLTAGDASLIVMPLFHVHGLLGATLSTLHSGGTVIIPPRFSASSFWKHVAEHRVTWYSAVPTIHQVLLSRAEADQAPDKGLRFIRSCSAALAPAVLAQLERRFGAPVLEAYGMTEAAHQMSSNPVPPGPRQPGTVGRGTGVAIAILDDQGKKLPPRQQGEVAIQGPNVMRGYHNNPQANATAFTNGFFRTGDQGFLDEQGYLTLTGRLKELINRGGEKISPLEVDAALLEHPAVAEAVAFAVPDAKYGEEVQAAVVLKALASAEEIQAFCRQRLADFKVPKRIHITQQVPRTATGKIQRRHVAAHFAGNQG